MILIEHMKIHYRKIVQKLSISFDFLFVCLFLSRDHLEIEIGLTEFLNARKSVKIRPFDDCGSVQKKIFELLME